MSMDENSSGKGEYVQGSPFVELFETKGRARILDVFLRKHYKKLTSSDISYYAGVDTSTFSRNKDLLLKMDVIREVKSEQRAVTYELNTDSPIVQALRDLQTELIDYVDEIQDNSQRYNKKQLSDKLFDNKESSGSENHANSTLESVMQKSHV